MRMVVVFVARRQTKEVFQLDELCRPRHCVANDFEENGDSTVNDRATRLPKLFWRLYESGIRRPLV